MNTEKALQPWFAAIERHAASDTAIAALHIDEERTTVAWRGRAGHVETIRFEAGSSKTAREHFLHHPPSALELETAIAAVEEAIMHVQAVLPAHATLYTVDRALAELAAATGATTPTLPLENVEQLFNRLAAISLGKPMSQETVPLSPEFYATMLILREFMHHAGYASLSICHTD